MFKYFKSLTRVNSGNSSKSFGLLLSAVIGGILGLCIGAVILYDGFLDGTLDTDMHDLGWLLICDSVFMFGGGLGKVISEFREKADPSVIKQSEEEENGQAPE